MTDAAPPAVEPLTLEAQAEKVRERLIANGQHGALAEFGKYTAAVHERLGPEPRPLPELLATFTPTNSAPVPTSARPKAKAPRKARAGK